MTEHITAYILSNRATLPKKYLAYLRGKKAGLR